MSHRVFSLIFGKKNDPLYGNTPWVLLTIGARGGKQSQGVYFNPAEAILDVSNACNADACETNAKAKQEIALALTRNYLGTNVTVAKIKEQQQNTLNAIEHDRKTLIEQINRYFTERTAR